MQAVNVAVSSWNPFNSYGRIACTLSDGLRARGCHINEIGGGAQDGIMLPVLGGIFLGYPTGHERFGALANAGKRLAITMFESSCLPEGWAEALNACACAVVPSAFLVDVFRNAGVTVPIEVIPLGINPAFMKPVRRTLPEDGQPLTFFALLDRGNRKNGHGAAFAFHRAFGDDTRFRLLLKSRDKGQAVSLGNPNMEIVQEDITDAELAALYRRCHVMLFPARGEGYGFPPREFAATGGIALATNWGGLADDIDAWGVPLSYAMESAWSGHKWAGALGEWAAPDLDDLAAKMRLIADDFERYAEFGMQAAAFVQTHYKEETFVERVWSVYERYCL